VPFTPLRRPSPPPQATVRTLPTTRILLALFTIVALTGCGAPPELRQPSSVPTVTGTPTAPGPTGSPTASPTAVPTAPPVGTPSATPDAGLVAIACRNGPTGHQVLRLLRGRTGVLPNNVQVKVRSGPLCAADWQYTVVTVTGHEELQVVTRGRPTAPELVTAGTDVCTAEVRATGPVGIRTLACDAGTPPGSGA